MNAPLIPNRFDEIVSEIVQFTNLPLDEVKRRVWNEAFVPGCNIVEEARLFEVTPHRFDERMARLYRDGFGFIFAGLVYWNLPIRRRWSELALERIQQYCALYSRNARSLRILMFGDGTGNDSLLLACNGYDVDYFDVPGSKSFDFARKRFEQRGLLGKSIHVLTEFSQLQPSSYDVVFSFEVLEHLPEPLVAIREIARLLKNSGIALITESFSGVTDELPTHLADNLQFSGSTPFLFLQEGLHLTWFTPQMKPLEFTKRPTSKIHCLAKLLTNRAIVSSFLRARWQGLKRTLRSRLA